MDFSKFESLVQTLSTNPRVKASLDEWSKAANEEDTHLSDLLSQGLAVISGTATLFPGEKAKKVGTVTALVGILIQLSILLKRKVIDDPDVQKKMQAAWAELEAQSSALAEQGKQLLEKVTAKVKSKV